MDIFADLSLKRIINGAGTKTRLSGSYMPAQVVDAMVQASKSLFDIEELQAFASRVISQTTGAESGLVTTGAAAGLTLATAACVAGLDIAKMERLPDTSGMRNQVVLPRSHRNGYDHAIRAVGVKLIEAGMNEVAVGVGTRSTEPWEIEQAITNDTIAVAYFAKQTTPSLGEIIKIAKEHQIYSIVDAAAELPPATNLRKFVSMGVDAVVFSGGKAVRGPQSSGILCGRRDLIMSAALQMLDMDCRFETWNPPGNFIDKGRLRGMPRHGIGRGFKAGKEEIVGLITALTLFANRDEGAELRKYEKILRVAIERLQKLDRLTVNFLEANTSRAIPLVEVKFSNVDLSYMIKLIQFLKSKDPPIYLDERRLDEMVLQINPFNLDEGDVQQLSDRLVEAVIQTS